MPAGSMSQTSALLLVGLGGGLGSICRYLLGSALLQASGQGRFPLGTLAVNVIGCLLAGLLAGLVQRHELLDAQARLFLFTGLLGGFTTFSAFGLETVQLLRQGQTATAALYAGASLACGLAAVWGGIKLVDALTG